MGWPVGPIKVNLTGYWPFQAGLTPDQRKLEGGVTDRKGKPLHTFEDHRDDPEAHPFISIAGDYTLWSYGQRVSLPSLGEPSDEWKAQTGESEYVCRVVDTGGHFYGAGKVYRHPGWEPLDVCVNSSTSTADNGLGMGQQDGYVPDESTAQKALNAVGDPSGSATGLLPVLLLLGFGVGLAWFIASGTAERVLA